MRSNWKYLDYLRETTIGMLTGWERITWYWRDVVNGFRSFAFIAALAVVPFLFWLSPLIALLGRASDRRDAEQRRKNEAAARGRIHRYGPIDHGREG